MGWSLDIGLGKIRKFKGAAPATFGFIAVVHFSVVIHTFADLYQRRWRVELFLKQIKVTLKMETLRCLSPEMIRKELWMHLIAYTLIRSLTCRLLIKRASHWNESSSRPP